MHRRSLTLALVLLLLPVVSLATEIPIVGRILGPDGKPQAKAEVHLEPIPATYERALLRLEGRAGPEPEATTRSAADGTFELAAPRPGMWKVVVAARGMLRMEARLVPLVDLKVLPEVELIPAADLEVRLVDAAGKPRSGAVGAVTAGQRRRSAWLPQLRLAKAGEDGIARLPLGKDEKIQLEVLGDGHPLMLFDLYDETSVEIKLQAGIAGSVRVLDQQKRPRAQAIAFQGSALLPLALSDDEGHLSFVLQSENAPALKLVTKDRWNGSFEIDPEVLGKQVKDLRLDPPATMRGRVIDFTNREPVAGAVVWAVRGESAITDGQGGYSLDVGIYKARWVQAAASGYQNGHGQLKQQTSSDVAPIALEPAGALSGKVVDGEGKLIEGAEVRLAMIPQMGRASMAVQRRMGEQWRGRTSQRGLFRVTGLPTGVGFQLTCERQGFAKRLLDVPPIEPGETPPALEVVLEPGRVAFGQVVDEADVPIAGAEVMLESPPPSDDLRTAMYMMRRQEEEKQPTYLTDSEGRFEISDINVGRYDLRVKAFGFAPAKIPGVQVTEDGDRVDLGTVVLSPGARIEGRVVDGKGNAISEVLVHVESGRSGMFGSFRSEPEHRATSDAQGRFVISDLLPEHPVTVTASKKGWGSDQRTGVQPPTTDPLELVLEPSGRISGIVLNKEREPVANASVMAQPDHRAMAMGRVGQSRPAWARTRPDGRFVIEDVPYGSLQVIVNAKDYQQQTRTGVEIEPGSELELELVLEAGAVVEGTVTRADGQPVMQASIDVSERRDGFFSGLVVSANGQTDVEGRYRVSGAPTGQATITVYHQGGQQLVKNVEVQPGNNVFDLRLEGGYEIRGQVVGPDATPIGGATISLQQSATGVGMFFAQGGEAQAITSASGVFTLTDVRPGKYVVSAKREGFATANSETLEVTSDVDGLLLELDRGATLTGKVIGLEFDELGALSVMVFGTQGGMRRGHVDFSAGYTVGNLSPGQWHIRAEVGGSGRSLNAQVEVPEGVTEVQKDIEFGAGFTLTGIVLDNGQPLFGASVNAISPSGGSSGHAMTSADGRFRVEGLAAGVFQISVAAGIGIHHSETVELAGDHDLRIEIATGSLSGRVLDATSGEPLSGVTLTLESSQPGQGMMFAGNQAETDSMGRFTARNIRLGTLRVVANRQGYAPGEATVVVSGEASPEVEIRLTPTEGVSFEVVSESGIPPQMLQIALLDATGKRVTTGTYTVAEGRVRVSTVPPGRWDLAIQANDSAVTRVTVNSPGDQGRVVLRTGGTLHIKVPELEAVQMAQVELRDQEGKIWNAAMTYAFSTDGGWPMYAGQAMVPALTPGVWNITVRHGERTWSGSATVTAGGVTEVQLP